MVDIDMLKSIYREHYFNDMGIMRVSHVKLLFKYKPRKLN